MAPYIAVAAGGAIGAMSRFAVGGLALRIMGPGYPWGTLAVNVAGGFLIGVLVTLIGQKFSTPHIWQAGLVTGLLGGFTTFSAFSLEAALMIERHDWSGAITYALVSVILCILAVFAGLFVARSLV
ncbi:MAG: fluoride efflux transporter CrcB [Proteobacteria bacterium]|nr:fluoride efflux transporter CrcB [Pseudomonadota bacterium]